MNVPFWVWAVTIAGLLALLAIDVLIAGRNPHHIGIAEATRWVTFYAVLAVAFGITIGMVSGQEFAVQFFAGYITEYSLSIDNLFVFVLILASFAVPQVNQYRVLFFGIITALILRGLFIAAGAAMISRFDWIFYVFGAFLIYTAARLLLASNNNTEEYQENRLLRALRRILPITDGYHGAHTVVKIHGRRYVTPMLIVMIAVGTTDLVFALDSIPAIFGLTREPFLVFTANAFALMGLRQLFFLIGGLLEKLVYLNIGLAVVLGFIGLKLVFEAMAGNGIHWAPHIGIGFSLAVIAAVLLITTLASLLKVRRDPSAVRHFGSTGSDNSSSHSVATATRERDN